MPTTATIESRSFVSSPLAILGIANVYNTTLNWI